MEHRKLRASTYTLFFRTLSFHWNVRGENFAQYHKLFQKQYEDLFDATDLLAERVRAIGGLAPTSLSEIVKLSSLAADAGAPVSKTMIANLLSEHEASARALKSAANEFSRANDKATENMLLDMVLKHEKVS